MSEIKEILRECELEDVLAIFVGFPVIGFLLAVILTGAYLLVS